MNILDKVARAICKAEGCFPWHLLPIASQQGASATADAAITAFLAAAAEQGWHMRPDEATANMKEAGDVPCTASYIYCAMLAAAPKFEWDKKTSPKLGKPPPGGL